MGQSPSKRIEEILSTSSAFQTALHASFEECMILAQHSFPGLQIYQLLDASRRIYHKIATDGDDVLSRYKDRWLPQPPSQLQVDSTVRKERFYRGGQKALDIDEFRVFAIVLFRDMGLTTARNRLALYVPLGSLAVLVADLAAKKLPIVGPMYRAGGPLMPGVAAGVCDRRRDGLYAAKSELKAGSHEAWKTPISGKRKESRCDLFAPILV